MSKFGKKQAAKAAKAGASGAGHIVRLVFKILGIFLLIMITTGAMLACIFVIYVKTNLVNSDLGIALEDYSLSETSVIYYQDPSGNYQELCSILNTETRYWVDYEDIPANLEHAVVAIEDQRFYDHNGVDWYRTVGAFVNMFLGMKDTFGGSTITQQVIKNVTGYDDVTVQRKLTEIFRALELEKDYEKWEIITWYLNVAFFGHGNRGIGAAAKYYFDKDVSDLTLAEICSIVGITNNPSLYSPRVNPERNKARQELILDQMLEQGYITEEECSAAKAEELNFAFNRENQEDSQVYSWFAEAVIDDVTDYFAESRDISRDSAAYLLRNGGYTIYCTMDKDIQDAVDLIYQDLTQIPATTGSEQQLQSAIVITDPYTGDIVALAGGVGEKVGNLLESRATESRRPPGSSFKPLSCYAPAMNLGVISPDTIYEDEGDIVLSGTSWFPNNDDYSNRGPVSIRQAIISSINTVAAQVLDDLGVQTSYSFLTNDLGLNLDPADCDYAPLAMGQLTYGITVREMAEAYGMFPNSGVLTESRTFSAIYDSDGNLIYENEPESKAVISEAVAYWMTDILNDAATYGTGSGANLGFMPTAGKTGSTSNYQDRWFVGFTPYYVAAVWTGYDTPERIRVSGGNPASQLWKKVMTIVHEDMEYKDFARPSDTYIPSVQGVDVVSYYVRGISVDSTGGVSILYEEEAGSRAVGREVTVTANEVEGYTLVGESSVSITLSEDAESNVVEFTYTSNEPVEPEEPDDPLDPDNPTDPDNPDNPDDPNNPTDPSTPSDPSNPTDPSNPSDPSDPTTPTDPVDPSTPTDPANPETPADPSAPSDSPPAAN